MAVPHGARFPIAFDDLFPQGAYLMGDIQPGTEYKSQEDKARNRPIRPRIDEATSKRLYRATIADPSVEKERDTSISVETVGGLSLPSVELAGMMVQLRADEGGQAKRISRVMRAIGLCGVDGPASGRSGSARAEGKSAA